MVFLFLPRAVNAQYSIPSKMAWWYEARFGMFMHFGSYSYLGHGEWAFATESWTKENYQTQVTANFNPVQFDAGEIARLAKRAGMRYLVITAKHHEGFCMWQTAVQSFKDYTGTTLFDLPDFTAFKTRDILKELRDSCEANGVRFCLYYSILDWNHPSQTIYKQNYSTMAGMDARADYINDMKAQLGELIEQYHPHILWFDGDWTYNSGAPTLSSWWTKNDGVALYDTLIKIDSNLVVNERIFRGAGLGDYECPEQKVPSTPPERPWETCQTMNNSWGYASWDNNYKTPRTLIRQLVDVVSKDGNYLLNVGPKGDGTIPDPTVSILTSFADWMNIYSESIYGTTRTPYNTTPAWGRFTKKEGKLYAHVFTWPENGLLKIPSLTNTVCKIYLLNDTSTTLNYTDSLGYICISVPAEAPDAINSVVVIRVTGLPAASTQYIKVTQIIVEGENVSKTITTSGGTLQMSATVTPSDVTDKTVTWSVSDTTIGTISGEGLLTARKDGNVTVIATANDGSDICGSLEIAISSQSALVKKTVKDKPVVLFPNPVHNGILNISQNLGSTVDIAILNIHGQQVVTRKMNGEHIALNVSGLTPGIYTVKLSAGGKEDIQRLIRN
jgi:alpha-L-fucosidase